MQKRRLTFFVLMAFVFMFFMGEMQVEAKAGYFGFWNNELQQGGDSFTTYVEVEKGQKFNIAEWASIEDSNTNDVTTEKQYKKLKFISSNKKVATVSRVGLVNAKRTGKTTIRITKGKMKITCHLKVVKKKKLTGLVKNSAKMNSGVNRVVKLYNGKVTDKNYAKLVYAIYDAESLIKNNSKLKVGTYKKKNGKYFRMIIPKYYEYTNIQWDVMEYLSEKFMSEKSQQPPLVSALSFSGKTGTAVLEREVDAYDILYERLHNIVYLDISYGGDAYKALKKKHCIREITIYRIADIYTTETYTLKLYYAEGKKEVKVKSDKVLPGGTYMLYQFDNNGTSKDVEIIIE